MRLSKKGWNNVLIFAVLIVIFIFNFSHKLLLSPKVNERTIIDKQLTIVELHTPDFTIKRVGRGWVSKPEMGLSQQQLTSLMQNWQHLKLTAQPLIKNPKSPFVIQVYNSSQEQPTIVQLIQLGENYLLQIDNETSLFLDAKQLPLLLGR